MVFLKIKCTTFFISQYLFIPLHKPSEQYIIFANYLYFALQFFVINFQEMNWTHLMKVILKNTFHLHFTFSVSRFLCMTQFTSVLLTRKNTWVKKMQNSIVKCMWVFSYANNMSEKCLFIFLFTWSRILWKTKLKKLKCTKTKN